MRIVRFLNNNNNILYGVIEGKDILKIDCNILGEYKVSNERFNLSSVKLLSPIEPPNIIAIGLNYRIHAIETNMQIPERPVIFLKATSSMTGPNDDIIIPESAPDEVDYEAELAVIISKKAKNINIENIDDYILGYTCANDVSARDCQMKLDVQWARAKSFDTFCPLGPWIETELNTDNLRVISRLNGEVMQDSYTSDMIFNVKTIVSYCSKNMTLFPGTVILTGTPDGVGVARKTPVFLKPKDIIEVEIEGIGVLKNRVINQ